MTFLMIFNALSQQEKNQYSDQPSKLIIGFETDTDYYLLFNTIIWQQKYLFAGYIDSDSF